ncbi:unnamed protein product [Knipowitschia caucasica]|uniref:Uncharacterized protein n=1 Tax=Knipowitschia caucasica TaxID=637954 RepID=A0AAV2K2H9_KNICA
MQSHTSSSPPLLALALLLLPHSSTSPLPTHEPPALGLTLLQLLDPNPEQQEAPPSTEPFFSWYPSNQDSNLDSVQDTNSDQDTDQYTDLDEDQDLLRSQRGEVGHDEENRLSEALSVVAGGLQSVSREKGGFGFRFGRRGLSRI